MNEAMKSGRRDDRQQQGQAVDRPALPARGVGPPVADPVGEAGDRGPGPGQRAARCSPWCSCACLLQGFTEDAGRPEQQHDHQDDEGDHVLPLRTRRRSRPSSRPGRAATPPSSAPRMLPMPPSTAAVNALMPRMNPMLKPDVLELHGVEHAGDAGHRPAEQEGQPDDGVDVDAHQHGGLRVLGGGPDAAADPGAARPAGPAAPSRSPRRSSTITWSVRTSALPMVNSTSRSTMRGTARVDAAGPAEHPRDHEQREQLLQEQRRADRGDQRGQPGRAAPAQRPVGDDLQQHRRAAGDRRRPPASAATACRAARSRSAERSPRP